MRILSGPCTEIFSLSGLMIALVWTLYVWRFEENSSAWPKDPWVSSAGRRKWLLNITFFFFKSRRLLLSRQNTFYGTLNLTVFSNFTVILHTFTAKLDLTCSSFRGLNYDDFPFLKPSLAELAPFKD